MIYTPQHGQLISESIIENHIIVHIIVNMADGEFNRIKSCKQLEIRQNAAMILGVSISCAIRAGKSRDSLIIIHTSNIAN